MEKNLESIPDMNFSIEELYFMYGQYNAFVMLEFKRESSSYKLFGLKGLMGRFKFTLYEKRKLEASKESGIIERTEGMVKFFPSRRSDHSPDLLTLLDRDGILCSDISQVNSSIRKRENRFAIRGDKEIPDQMTINITKNDDSEADLLALTLYRLRLTDGCKLLPFESHERLGLLMYYNPSAVLNHNAVYTDESKTKIKDEIMLRYLLCKQSHQKLSEEDEKELNHLWEEDFQRKEIILVREIQKNGLQIRTLDDLPRKDLIKAVSFIINFEDDIILPYKHPIWCDFERLAHIYIGHVKELYIGKPDSRTFFQYTIKETRSIISIVVEMIYDEYYEVISANPNGTWGRRGPRAIEFDGNYYRVEIDTQGRLMTFHPYNNFEEAKKDSEV